MEKEFLEKYNSDVNCPVRTVLDKIGDKWSVLVILLLKEEKVLRFNEMNKMIGDISQKMLTVTLRSLEADGLVQRTIYPVIPPKVEYKLTAMGEDLYPFIRQLTDWAVTNMAEIRQSREKFRVASY